MVSTEEHPFYVTTSDGWVGAKHIVPGQRLAGMAQPWFVMGTEMRARSVRVYNFEVEGTHTYFIGVNADPISQPVGWVWVHNTCAVVNALEQALKKELIVSGTAYVDRDLIEMTEGQLKAVVEKAGGNYTLALGLYKTSEAPALLNDFAKAHGAKTYFDVFGKRTSELEMIKTEVLQAMNAADSISFNLNGIVEERFFQFLQRPVLSWANITNWELLTVLRNPSLMRKARFYDGAGKLVALPSIIK